MDPRDRLLLRLVGTSCGACGGAYAEEGIQILAQREDLAFVLLHCAKCGSDGLGLVTEGEPDEAVGVTFQDSTASNAKPGPGGPPISADDVLAVHELLASHDGDLRSLLGRSDQGPRGS